MPTSLISLPVYCHQMVGRRAELECILKQFTWVNEGTARTILISGDAGIGKSRLVEAFRDKVNGQARFYSGQCLEHVQSPYLPFEEILSDIARSPIRSRKKTGAHGLDATESKLRYFSAVADSLRIASTQKIAVVVVEDIHWADTASLELISYLAHGRADARVLLLVTMRHGPLTHQSDLMATLASLRRNRAIEIELRALQRSEIREVIYHALRGRPAIPTAVRAHIEEAAEGNPLFIEELLRSAIDGTLERVDRTRRVPVTIRAILRQRLLDAAPQDVELLRVAAVIGRTFDVAFLASVASIPHPQVLCALQTACEKQLVIEEDTSPATFHFRHALIQEALYFEVPHYVARPLHAKIAAHLMADGGTEINIAALAYHWAAAGESENAIRFNEQAGDRALDLGSGRDASEFYRRALEFQYPAGRRRARIYEKLAVATQLEGEVGDAASWLGAAIAEYRLAGDSVAIADALLSVSQQSWLDGRTESSLAPLEEALALLAGSNNARLLALVGLTHARFLVTLGRVVEANASLLDLEDVITKIDLEDSIPSEMMARPVSDLKPAFYEVRAEIRGALGDAEGAIRDFEYAAALADELGLADALLRIENAYAMTACDLGRTESSVASHKRALDLCIRSPLAWRNAYVRVNAAQTLFLTGELQQARGLILEGLTTGIDNVTLRCRSAAIGLPIALSLCDTELIDQLLEARTLDEAFLSGEPQRFGSVSAAFSMVYRARGELDRAVAIVRRAMNKISRFHRCWPIALEACILDDEAGHKALTLLSTQNREVDHLVAGAFEKLCRAEYFLRRDEKLEAAASAKTAARDFATLRWPVFEAAALKIAGETNASLAISLRIGDVRQIGYHRAVKGSSAEQVRTDKPRLTPRQIEIAQLVSEGCSNRMIAEALSITEGTVENHLVAIFDRTAVRSRSQLVAYLLRLQNKP